MTRFRMQSHPLLKLPGFRLMIPFVAGLLLARYAEIAPGFPGYGIALIFIIILQFSSKNRLYRHRHYSGIISMLAILFCGFLSQNTPNEDREITILDGGKNVHCCSILTAGIERKASVRFLCEIFDSLGRPAELKGLLYLEKDSISMALLPGDKLVLIGSWERIPGPKNPGEFDLSSFYSESDVFYRSYASIDQWQRLESAAVFSFKRQAAIIRSSAIRIFNDNGLQQDLLPLAAAMFLGDRSGLSQERMDTYAEAGVVHVLCVSGMHAGIIFMVLGSFLDLFRIRKKAAVIRLIIMLSGLWSFAFLTGLSPSVLRAASMLSLVSIGKVIRRRSDTRGILALAVFILILIDPSLIVRIGFQLSALAVFGILEVQSIASKAATKRSKVISKLTGLLMVSIAAQLFTAPLTVYLFHRFPIYFLISNLLVLPLASIVMWLGVIVLCMSFLPHIAEWLTVVLNHCLLLMDTITVRISNLPHASLDGLVLSEMQTVLFYLALSIVIVFFRQRDGRKLKWVFLLLVIILIQGIYFTFRNNSQSYIQAYSLGPYLGLDLVDGRSTCFIHSIPDDVKELKMSMSVRPNRTKRGIKYIQEIDMKIKPDTLMTLQLDGHRFKTLTCKKLSWRDKIKIDADTSVLLIGGYYLPDTLIIGGSPKAILLACGSGSCKIKLLEADTCSIFWLGDAAVRLNYDFRIDDP